MKGMGPVVFVDTETTGLDPDLHEIWEVGLITPDGKEHQWQLPVDLGRADPISLRINRFYERRAGPSGITDLRPFASAFSRLTAGSHFVGAIPSFDEERLRRLLRANGACPDWHYHLIDVEALIVGYLARKVHENENLGYTDSLRPSLPWNSEDLSRAVGVEPDADRHEALADARWAKRLYEAVML